MAEGVITLIICKTATAAKACSRVFRWASPTEALGSTTVGTAVPRTATRSVCQSQIGPNSAVAQDTYLRCARSETALVGPIMPGSFYAYTLQSWRPICALAKAILDGGDGAAAFFATFCRTKKPWDKADKAPSMELPNSHVLLQLGLCKFGRMLLPLVGLMLRIVDCRVLWARNEKSSNVGDSQGRNPWQKACGCWSLDHQEVCRHPRSYALFTWSSTTFMPWVASKFSFRLVLSLPAFLGFLPLIFLCCWLEAHALGLRGCYCAIR